MSLYRKARPDELAISIVADVPPRVGQDIEVDGLGVVTVLTASPDVLTVRPVNTDRHRPGYMAEYMRKRRAKK